MLKWKEISQLDEVEYCTVTAQLTRRGTICSKGESCWMTANACGILAVSLLMEKQPWATAVTLVVTNMNIEITNKHDWCRQGISMPRDLINTLVRSKPFFGIQHKTTMFSFDLHLWDDKQILFLCPALQRSISDLLIGLALFLVETLSMTLKQSMSKLV